jgi:general secretion pathway protein D
LRPKIRLFFLFSLLSAALFSQTITEMEFRNQPVRDILLVLAQVSGSSIITDETVTGNGSYYFSNTDLETALDQFLGHYSIYYWKDGDTYYVSKIKTGSRDGSVSCTADDVDFQLLIRRLSRDFGITILHDALPRENVTVNYRDGTLPELLEILLKPFPLFHLEAGDRYYYLRKESSDPVSQSGLRGGSGDGLFTREGREYSADFEKIRFREALTALLDARGVEFSFLGRNDGEIALFKHQGRSFDEMLNLLLQQGNASFQESGGVYYIFDRDRQDILKDYFITERLELQNIAVDRLSSLIPSGLGGSGSMKLDKDGNRVILSGNLADIKGLEDFIRKLDAPGTGREYRRYDLQFITVDEFQKRRSPEVAAVPLIALGESSFLCTLTPEKHGELEEYLPLVDTRLPSYPIHLSYLTWEELLEILPNDIGEDQLHETKDPSLFFFQGTRGELALFEEQLSRMDRPVSQIRYEVLVLQVEESQGLNLQNGMTASLMDGDSSNALTASLSGLASLSFDVVSQFGLQFATELSLELTDNRSRVLADTTLHGLSGEELNFQNTNTSRIATTTVDADTGDTKITGYQEITSGLIIGLSGWVSGDGMITMEVEATISSETSSSSNSDGKVPSTTEKVVNTHVRSRSGEPVILSGLKEQQTIQDVKKVPFLSDIPLLGLLFQKRTETLKNTEFLITLIPYKEEDNLDSPDRVYADIYAAYCGRGDE